MLSIFNNNKSKKYTIPFYLFMFFLFSITISGFILPEKTNYKTIEAGQTFIVDNNKLLLESINKTDDFVYLEVIDHDWLNNIGGYKFEVDTKENLNYKTTPEIKVSYRGYFLIKIPLKNDYSSFKLTTIKDVKNIEGTPSKEVSVYFNEHQLKINNDYRELDEKEYIVNYLNLLVSDIEKKIRESKRQISINQEIINNKMEDIELIEEQKEFQTGDEIKNSDSLISNKNNKMAKLEDDILAIEDSIILLKNKILKLESEIYFVETGEKTEAELLKTRAEKEEEERKEEERKAKEEKEKEEKEKKERKKDDE